MDRTKPHTQLFILLPETEPQHLFLHRNEGFQAECFLSQYFGILSHTQSALEIENYVGFYDGYNIHQFLLHYEILDDCYLSNSGSVLRILLRSWLDWRAERQSDSEMDCRLLGQSVKDNTFSEIAIRRKNDQVNNHLLASHQGISIPLKTHELAITGDVVKVDILSLEQVPSWFCVNRRPRRIYHPSPKHGENGVGEWRDASKLLCSHAQAEKMLHYAIGSAQIDELYFFDDLQQSYIIYRHEGNNIYHAYHVVENDVPPAILSRLNKPA